MSVTCLLVVCGSLAKEPGPGTRRACAPELPALRASRSAVTHGRDAAVWSGVERCSGAVGRTWKGAEVVSRTRTNRPRKPTASLSPAASATRAAGELPSQRVARPRGRRTAAGRWPRARLAAALDRGPRRRRSRAQSRATAHRRRSHHQPWGVQGCRRAGARATSKGGNGDHFRASSRRRPCSPSSYSSVDTQVPSCRMR